ncbi:ribosome small subunit-dependent GTPase A [Paenibacillus sp. 481]|nr:ribosome small subunit-dependent GTPase A [Paenibacillus sp. 481]
MQTTEQKAGIEADAVTEVEATAEPEGLAASPLQSGCGSLTTLGWDERWDAAWEAWLGTLSDAVTRRWNGQLVPARVSLAHKHLYRVIGADGEWLAEVSGQARNAMLAPNGWPTVGDWVAVAPRPAEGRATLVGVLPRRSEFARKVAGNRNDAQLVAANADVALLVTAMTSDFEPRRLERYAALAWESGAMPAVVLTKADATDDENGYIAEAMQAVPGADVYPVSSHTGAGLDRLRALLAPGKTLVLVGSSGVGKSTLANALTGSEHMITQAVREEDGKGRHTTTHRELIPLANGAWLIDTPGMREVGLVAVDGGHGLASAFDDVESLVRSCRFTDCKHANEPGCAVRAAVEQGELEPQRLNSYWKLQRELAHIQRSENAKLKREHARSTKKLHKSIQSAARQRK